MSGIFMYGNPLNFTLQYYILGKTDGKYFYLSKNIPKYKNDELAPDHLFISLQYSSGSITPTSVIIKENSNNYGLQSLNEADQISYFTNELNNTMLCSSPTLVDFKINTSELITLYPGLWYKILNTNDEEVLWPIVTCNDSTHFCKTVLDEIKTSELEIMFIPVNTSSNQLSTWTNLSNPDGTTKVGCGGDNGNNLALGLIWSDIWITNPSSMVNCVGPTTLSESSLNCRFASIDACNSQYLYSLCNSAEVCGACLGGCSEGNCCQYDKPGAVPALFCNENTKNEKDKKTDPLMIVFLVFCILFFIFVMVVLFKPK